MRKPGILKVVPSEVESLSHVQYLRHKGDDAPSVYKKGDIISVGEWQKAHESKERYWKQWWTPVWFCVIQWDGEIMVPHSQINYTPGCKNIIDNEGKCMVEWEENQCDGCKAKIPLRDGHIHQKPNDRTDPFGIGCTAELYDRPKLTNGKATIYSV